jgi:outer membrane protein
MHRVIATLGLALFAAAGIPAQTPPGRIAVINMQAAMAGTKDGQKASAELNAKYGPKQKEIQTKQAEVESLKEQLQKGQNTLTDAVKNDLYVKIDQKTKAVNRDMEDDRAELEQDQGRLVQDISQKMYVVINKFAQDNGYSLVIDVSGQQSPVLFASNTIDITKQIVDLYDTNAAAMAPSAPASGAKAPVRAGAK